MRNIGLFFLAFLVGIYLLKAIAFRKAPCENEMTLGELQKQSIAVEYVETDESWSDESLSVFCQRQMELAENCNTILKARPTGNIYFNQSVILQEVFVEDVMTGDCPYKKIWLDHGLASTMIYQGNQIILSGMERSFMQEDCEYLLFCDPVETNRYSDRKVYREMDEMWIGCYNITRDCMVPVKKDYPLYDEKIEFYCTSEKLLGCYRDTKKMLLEKYLQE